jgi:hypothetical protein
MRKHRILFARPAPRYPQLHPQNPAVVVDKMVEKVKATRLDMAGALWYNDPRR